MQELVDYADVRRVLPVTRIRLGAMDLQELLSYMTNASISFRGAGIGNIERIVVDRAG
jgi:hypothetical protein